MNNHNRRCRINGSFAWRLALFALSRSFARLRSQSLRGTRLLLLVPFFAWPASALAQFNYSTNGGKITITGYIGSGGDVEIPEAIDNMSVVAIGTGAFNNCATITSITIPRTVTKLGDSAFGGCSNLQAIVVSALNPDFSSSEGVLFDKNRVTLIQCPGGTAGSLNIPGGITTIGNYALYKCVYLTDVILPNGVVSIGKSSFYGCSSLTNINMSETVATIGEGAFYGCPNLGGITLPNGVISIGAAAFADCTGLGSIALPNSITAITSQAFSGCSNLVSIAIPLDPIDALRYE